MKLLSTDINKKTIKDVLSILRSLEGNDDVTENKVIDLINAFRDIFEAIANGEGAASKIAIFLTAFQDATGYRANDLNLLGLITFFDNNYTKEQARKIADNINKFLKAYYNKKN